jgi:hypothetical protein
MACECLVLGISLLLGGRVARAGRKLRAERLRHGFDGKIAASLAGRAWERPLMTDARERVMPRMPKPRTELMCDVLS